jgi:hypothetical protein
MKLNPKLLSDIADFINSKNGAHLLRSQIVQHFQMSEESAKRYCRELEKLKLILVHGGIHARSYSKIMPADLEITQPSRVYTCAPLAIDKQRRELYEQLAAARQAIPSRG